MVQLLAETQMEAGLPELLVATGAFRTIALLALADGENLAYMSLLKSGLEVILLQAICWLPVSPVCTILGVLHTRHGYLFKLSLCMRSMRKAYQRRKASVWQARMADEHPQTLSTCKLRI